jgi:hypothetical protein
MLSKRFVEFGRPSKVDVRHGADRSQATDSWRQFPRHVPDKSELFLPCRIDIKRDQHGMVIEPGLLRRLAGGDDPPKRGFCFDTFKGMREQSLGCSSLATLRSPRTCASVRKSSRPRKAAARRSALAQSRSCSRNSSVIPSAPCRRPALGILPSPRRLSFRLYRIVIRKAAFARIGSNRIGGFVSTP